MTQYITNPAREKEKTRPYGARSVLCALTLIMLFALGGCGKRPVVVDPPVGAAKTNPFPATYPDVGTDPAP